MIAAPAIAPPVEQIAETNGASSGTTNGVRPRIRGIDLARGLALFGMFAAHVGPSSDVGGLTGALMFAAAGHSSILFATLAGISLALLSGGVTPPGASDPRRTRLRIAVRGLLIMAIGITLTAMGTPVAVILAYYGVFFLLAIPFLRLKAHTLLVIAGCWAVAGPIVGLLIQSWWWGSSAADVVARVDPITLISGEGIDQLLDTGIYPAVTWMPFILVGLALGQLDITKISRTTLLAIGVGMAFVAYGFSALISPLSPQAIDGPLNAAGSLDWSILLGADAHTGSTFEIVGGIGIAIAVLAVCLVVAERLPRLTRPIAAAGSMSLTIYVAHVLTINIAGLDSMPGQPPWVLLTFIAGAIVFAVVWMRFARRGPLESLVHSTTAALVAPQTHPANKPVTDRRTYS